MFRLDLLSLPLFFQKSTLDEKERLFASKNACPGQCKPNLAPNDRVCEDCFEKKKREKRPDADPIAASVPRFATRSLSKTF